MSEKTGIKSVLQRINDGLDAALDADLPKDNAILTVLSIEMQVLENRIQAIEDTIEKFLQAGVIG